MTDFIWAFLAVAVIMTIIDSIWLTTVTPKFYKKHLGFMMARKPNLVAATIFYLIYTLGVTIFVVYPGWTDNQSLGMVMLYGAAFGLVTYATYDLTNQATLKKWPRIVTVVDIAWGTFLVASVSVASILLLRVIAG